VKVDLNEILNLVYAPTFLFLFILSARERERERENLSKVSDDRFFDQLKKINFSLLKMSRSINNCWCINNLWITSDWKRRICRELISENMNSWRKICFSQFQVTYACALTYYILHIIYYYLLDIIYKITEIRDC